MANKESDLIFEAYMEAKEAPKGKHYDSAGRLRSGDADADGRGGPKYRSDPTYVNPNDEEVRSLKGFEDEDTPAEDAILPVLGLAAAGGAASAVGSHIAKKILPKDKEDEEDDRVSSYLKLQKAKEEMPKVKEEPETKEEDDLGLGPNTPSMVRITSIGSTTPFKKKTEAPIEDEAVYIQAGEKEDCDCHDEGDSDKHEFDYDGEIDMSRAELLKANEYAAKLFELVAQAEALPGWVASKITKASDYLSSVYHYLDYEMNAETVEDEEDGADDFDPEEARDQESVELDTDEGTATAKNTGYGASESEEDDSNDELEERYYEQGMRDGLRGQELKDYVEDKMTQPGPHG